MAKLSSYRRIYEQDYEGQYQALVAKLGVPVNQAFSELYNALNNNLTFSENVNCTIATFNVSVDASGTPSGNTSIKLGTNQTSLTGMVVVNAFGSKDSNQLPTAGVFISFKKNNNYAIIENVKGLQASIPYTITVLAF